MYRPVHFMSIRKPVLLLLLLLAAACCSCTVPLFLFFVLLPFWFSSDSFLLLSVARLCRLDGGRATSRRGGLLDDFSFLFSFSYVSGLALRVLLPYSRRTGFPRSRLKKNNNARRRGLGLAGQPLLAAPPQGLVVSGSPYPRGDCSVAARRHGINPSPVLYNSPLRFAGPIPPRFYFFVNNLIAGFTVLLFHPSFPILGGSFIPPRRCFIVFVRVSLVLRVQVALGKRPCVCQCLCMSVRHVPGVLRACL